MANIKKNFNFRNGVQVDDDNLLVTSTGLVGIGTTVPTEALDVRGNVKIIGDATITNATVGVLTITNVVPTQIIGAGVSIKSGIITAQGSGIVTFYGDGINLLNLPTSQWEDTNAGFGVSSIYNTGGTVGIATTNPKSTIQIGDNPDIVGGRGVGISSVGDINASGIISATTFSGAFNGNVTGNLTGNITTATTISGNVDLNGDLDVEGKVLVGGGGTTASSLDISGGTQNQVNIADSSNNGWGLLLTQSQAGGSYHTTTNGSVGKPCAIVNVNDDALNFGTNNTMRWTIDHTGHFYPGGTGHLDIGKSTSLGRIRSIYSNNINVFQDLDVDGHTNLDNLSVSGVSTFSGRVEGAATNNVLPFLYSSMADLPSAGSYHGAVAHVHATGALYFAHAGQWWELVNKESDGRVGTGTENYNIGSLNSAGIITATTELNSPLIGVGTDAPANPIQVRGSGNTEIQVTSDTGIAGLTVGREPSTGNTNNAEFRYGGGSGFNYSSSQSLDIINYGTGNFNYHLSAANAGNVNGDFHWHKGVNNARLMTLTGIGGSLGIGITTPTTPLHVLGAATISGNVVLGGDLDVTGNAALNVVGRVTGDLIGNVFANSGVSTFKRLDLDTSSYYEFGELSASSVGIGTTMGSFKFVVNADADKKFSITDSGNVGIKTDNLNGNSLFVNGALVALDPIGIGTNVPRSAVDFADAGQATTGLAANRMYMIPPKVDTAQRGNLASLVSGALVYNTSTNTIQVYNGSSWGSLGSGGGGEANQNAFSNVAVSGQTTVAADASTDTLTLAAGSNVTITTTAGTDTVTIAAANDNTQLSTEEVQDIVGGMVSGGTETNISVTYDDANNRLDFVATDTTTFTGLTDTPGSLTAKKYLRVNDAGNALELKNSGLGDGFVNAADYGLDASATDGTNVTAINNAVTALGTNGGTIFFPGGMFYLNAAITLGNSNNSIRFVGSGHQNYGGGSDAGGTVLRRDADDEFFNITNSRAIHFIGITFKGGAANGSGGDSGISGGNGAIYVVANAGCQGYLIENCVFHGIANSIHFKGLSDSIIRGCRFRNVPSNEGAGACIKLDENGSEVIDQIRIQDCVLDGSPDGSGLNANVDGIAIYNTVSTVYITNTSAIRLKRSFYSDSSWDGNFFYFQNSEAERASSDGFSINGTGNFVTIDNCFSSTNNGHGINIGSSQNSSLNITNPNVRDNSGHGILIDGPTNNCSIVNPAVGGNSRGSSGTNHGIVIGSSANNVYITGGKIGGNTDELAGTGTQGYGIQINGGTHSNIRIIGTNVTGNATNSSEGITQSISSGTGNSIQFNAGSTTAIDT